MSSHCAGRNNRSPARAWPAIPVFLYALTMFGLAPAQPGEWCDLPAAPPALPGAHITWAGDSVWYFPGGGWDTVYVYDPQRNLTYGFRNPNVSDTGSSSVWAGGSYVYINRGRNMGFVRIPKNDPTTVQALPTSGRAGPGAAMCWTGGDSIFTFVGGGTGTFRRFSISSSAWEDRPSPPAVPWFGAALAWAGGDTVYALRGNDTREFWAYRVPTRTWSTKPQLPVPAGAGAALSWNGQSGSESKLFLVPGGGSSQLWSYGLTTGVWESLPGAPLGIGGAGEGALMAFDRRAGHQHAYAAPGSGSRRFLRYGPKVAASLPLGESFEGPHFPPRSWKPEGPLVTRRTSSTLPTAVPFHGTWMAVFALSGYPNTSTGLRTPPLLAGPSPRLVRMSFRMHQSPGAGASDTLYVCRSRDGVSYDTVAKFSGYASTANWYPKSITLRTEGADTLYAAFFARTGATGSRNVYVDSVRIWQPASWQDVEASAVLAPGDTVLEGALVTPMAVVRNNGTQSASFTAKFRIGSVYVDSQLVSGLAPDDSATLLFSSWTAQRGAYTAKCSTAMTGDEDPFNDAAAASCFVAAPDIGAVRVLAPSGAAPYDSGTVITPQLLVRNFGNVMSPVTAVFRVGGFYSDTSVLSGLNPGDSGIVSFRSWTMLERGTHAVRCTTVLAGDRSRANDTCSGSVTVRVRDVGAVRIVAPLGAVDSGTTVAPRAVVRNMGTVTESFSVRFQVGSFYANNQAVSSLSPGDSQLVTFSNWQAVQTGRHVTKCSTLMFGDMKPGNNAVADSVIVLPPSGVREGEGDAGPPLATRLNEPLPNPAGSRVLVSYEIAAPGRAEIRVLDLTGRTADVLVDGTVRAGRYRLAWNRCDDAGRALPGGVYFVQMRAGDLRARKKLLLLGRR